MIVAMSTIVSMSVVDKVSVALVELSIDDAVSEVRVTVVVVVSVVFVISIICVTVVVVVSYLFNSISLFS